MAIRCLHAIGTLALLLTLVASPARAETLDEYVQLTAELTGAAWGCQFPVEPATHTRITQFFVQLSPEKRKEAEEQIDAALAALEQRVRQIGGTAFCAEMIAKYGPNGTKQKGALKRQ